MHRSEERNGALFRAPDGTTTFLVPDGLARGKKSKETWPSSSDCSETAQPRKPKQRRKLSKKRRGDAAAAAAAGGDGGSAPPLGNNATWSVAGTSQWQYPTLLLVCNHTDLYQLHQFVYHKVSGVLRISRGQWRLSIFCCFSFNFFFSFHFFFKF